MGVYDYVGKAQIKCWLCEMKGYNVGDKVPNTVGYKDYTILLREGGFVKVGNLEIEAIIETPEHNYVPEDFPGEVCIDKWGDVIISSRDLESYGLMGEDYYYK